MNAKEALELSNIGSKDNMYKIIEAIKGRAKQGYVNARVSCIGNSVIEELNRLGYKVVKDFDKTFTVYWGEE